MIRFPELEKLEDAIVILSGGLDSCILLTVVRQHVPSGHNLLAVTFDYGQRHNKEIKAAHDIANHQGVPHVVLPMPALKGLQGSALTDENVDVPSVQETYGDPQPVTYVPNRNMVFLSTAAAVAEGVGMSTLIYGVTKHDAFAYWDTTADFFRAMNGLLSQNRKTPLSILTPFSTLTKKEIISLGFLSNAPMSMAWSCYLGGEVPCGQCAPCKERFAAFKGLGKEDPLCAALPV